MPLGDFTSGGFSSPSPPSIKSAVFPFTSGGLSGCKRSMNGSHQAGNFEVLNMAPERKRQRVLPEEDAAVALAQAQPLNHVADGCLPPVYGHYGCLPNFKAAHQLERAESLSLDAPLSSASAPEEFTPLANQKPVTPEVEMESCDTMPEEEKASAGSMSDVHMRIDDTMYGASHPICVYEHRNNCHTRGCREYLWEDMFLGYHGL